MRGVRWAATVAVLLVGAGAVSAVSAASAVSADRATGPLALTAGAYFGAFENPDRADGVGGSQAEVTALEADLGRRIDVDNRFYDWAEPIPTAAEYWDVAVGRIPMITWGAQDTLEITSGIHDAWIRAQAQGLRDLGAPVFLRFYHEMDGDYRQSIVHSSQAFIDAWRHVYGLFRQEGATNVLWVWCPTAWKFVKGPPWPPDFYPGDTFVDWVAADGYNWYPARPGSQWRTFAQVFGPFYDWAVTSGKPIMLAEIGVQEDPADPDRKAQWISTMQQQLKTAFDQVQAAVYFDTTIVKGGNTFVWDLRSSPQAFDAWRTLGLDPYFDRVFSPDMRPPSVPGQPVGVSTTPGQISLEWTASVDDRASQITYRVYRDGGSSAVGQVQSGSTTTVGLIDTGLVPGSVHTYEIDATDGVNASARSAPSAQITVALGPIPVFSDTFDAGLTTWTQVTNLAIDQSVGATAPPSARAQVSGLSAFARETLPQTYPSLCLSAAVNLTSIGTGNVQLLKLRTASNASIARLLVTPGRVLKVRADTTGTVFNTGGSLPGGWHTLELCVAVGTSGTLSASLDGTSLGSWTTALGTDPIGRIQILEDTAKTFTVNVDDVAAEA